MATSTKDDLDLLLLGKTGMGKSGTGNSILGRKAFKSIGTTESVTVNSRKDVAELEDGRKIYVVDTPGVADTGYSEKEGKDMFMTAAKEGIAMSPRGYHAVLLTLRYGSRLTEEDVRVLKYLKQVFGEKFIEKYCIILMTCGDSFKTDEENEDLSFQDWCKQQTGYFKTLYEEVKGRAMLFDNRGSVDVKAAQRQELVEMVDNLSVGGRRYTNEKFEKVRKAQEKVAKEKRETVLSEEIKDETSLILAKLGEIKEGRGFKSIDEQLDALKLLKVRSSRQLEKIDSEVKEEKSEILLKTQVIMQSAHMKIDEEMLKVTNKKELQQKRLSLEKKEQEAQRQAQEEAALNKKMEQAKLADEKEARDKQLEQERLAEEQRSAQRIKELEEQIKQQEANQKQSKKEMEKLTDQFHEVRDKSNSSFFGTVLDYATRPFRNIGSFLFGS